jgi:hypothetical protein
MSKVKRLTPTVLFLVLSLLTLPGSSWSACTQVTYYCDVDDAVSAGSGNVNKSGVYGYNNGHGWGVFGRTTSDLSSIQAGVGGENLGGGAGVYGHSAVGTGVHGDGSVGVMGFSPDANGVGVIGAGTTGIQGQTNMASGYAVIGFNDKGGVAVKGNTTSSGLDPAAAVFGDNGGAGPGVQGVSVNGNGVSGTTTNGVGVYGVSSNAAGVYGLSDGANAGAFQITNTTNGSAVIRAETAGTGPAGLFKTLNAASASSALQAFNWGNGQAGYFEIKTTTNNAAAVKAVTAGTGWAGYFTAIGPKGRGVYIKTAGGRGLTVVGGTKSAAVPTSQGTRALYAEEASEVYFTDYGFGRLENGRVFIPIDPLFAETVNLELDYFVFLQPYAKAEIYVSKTTPAGFEVSLNTGDPDAKFAYRLVAKRKGFETARLEDTSSQPESDSDLNAKEQEVEGPALSVTMNR